MDNGFDLRHQETEQRSGMFSGPMRTIWRQIEIKEQWAVGIGSLGVRKEAEESYTKHLRRLNNARDKVGWSSADQCFRLPAPDPKPCSHLHHTCNRRNNTSSPDSPVARRQQECRIPRPPRSRYNESDLLYITYES